MNLAKRAFIELFPGKDHNKEFIVKYSAKFSDYNANVSYTAHKYEFKLSRMWEGVSDEIQIGLIQSLFMKIFKVKKKTVNFELYELFLKNVHKVIPKIHADPLLQASFDRVNEKYLHNSIEEPNLIFGSRSFRKLGSYEYGTDTIMISLVLKEAPQHLLDYVMYHEMLHKKHKFTTSGKRSHHHTPAFKADEKKFHGYPHVEKELNQYVGSKRSFLSRFF